MEEIKHILKRYDIGASVVLHTPGHSEFLNALTPSYSCCKQNGDQLRIRAKLKEDFNGDKEAWTKKVTDTVNMIDLIATTTGNVSLSMFELQDRIKKVVDIYHNDGGFTSHTSQNN